MKNTAFLLFILSSLLFSCETNNDFESVEETVIITSDFSTIMDENPENNQLIGTISGTSNKGAVTFSIIEQSPTGAFLIDSSTGDLTVADKQLFDFETNPVITGLAKVEAAGVFETANITITLNKVDEPIVPAVLKSITRNRYNSDNQLTFWTKWIFQNDQLIGMEDNMFGVNSIETYANGLIKKRADAYTYNEYYYDANNRLIKTIYDGGDGPFTREFIYNGNEIEIRVTGPLGGAPYIHHKELNADNLIYKELVPGANNQTFVSVIDYVNGNPVFVDYAHGGYDTFDYNNTVGTDAYNFYKLIYGVHWKNNLILTRSRFSIGSFSEYVLNYISDNYVTQFKKEYSDGSSFGYNVNYDFDSDSNLIKETRNYFGIHSTREELIYEYD